MCTLIPEVYFSDESNPYYYFDGKIVKKRKSCRISVILSARPKKNNHLSPSLKSPANQDQLW